MPELDDVDRVALELLVVLGLVADRRTRRLAPFALLTVMIRAQGRAMDALNRGALTAAGRGGAKHLSHEQRLNDMEMGLVRANRPALTRIEARVKARGDL